MKYEKTSRNAACPCGSGKRYKHCHGNLSINESKDNDNFSIEGVGKNGYYHNSLLNKINSKYIKNLPIHKTNLKTQSPPGILCVENFIEDSLCDNIIKMTEKQHHTKATIVQSESDNNVEHVVEKERRTEIYYLEQFNELIKSKLEDAFKAPIKGFYKKIIKHYEQPHILRYSKGGFYHYHADSEYWDSTENIWHKSMRRDLSFLIYLNDDYLGGELVFKNFNFTLKPKKGLFVAFPSDHRFIHKVNPTISGLRYAIVSWAATEATFRDNDIRAGIEQLISIK